MKLLPVEESEYLIVLLSQEQFDRFVSFWSDDFRNHWSTQRFTEPLPRLDSIDHVFVDLGLPDNCLKMALCDEGHTKDFYSWCAAKMTEAN